MSATKVTLYMFTGSNSVLTARLMLEHKGIEYRRVQLLPGLHVYILRALGFQAVQVPALAVDGRRISGTRRISRALDELAPEPALFPAEPERRRAVEDAERWGEQLQNATRRIFYCAARRDPAVFAGVMAAEQPPLRRFALRLGAPLIVRLAAGAHRACEQHAREDLELLPERLDRIDAWIESGLLGGPELNAADFQIAANIALMLRFEDLAPFVAARPAAELARRVAPDYPGRVPAVLPTEWLAPLRTGVAKRGGT